MEEFLLLSDLSGDDSLCCTQYVLEGVSTVEIVYNEHEDQAEFARYNRFSL